MTHTKTTDPGPAELRAKTDGLARLEASARELASERDSYLPQLTVYKERIKQEEDRIFEENPDSSFDETRKRLREHLDMAYLEIEKLEESVATKERAIAEIESEISTRRLDYETLKAAVDDALDING